MKFTFNGNTYKITFQYDEALSLNFHGQPSWKESISTTCFIYHLQPEGNKQLIGSGVAKCKTEHDNFCKETGRKLALSRALDNAIYTGEVREFRTLAWKSYFARKENLKS